MKNLLAAGFLFVGGAILMTADSFGPIATYSGAVCAVIGVGLLLYYVFSDNGKYGE